MKGVAVNLPERSQKEKRGRGAFRILVVEHHASLAESLRYYLQALGHTVQVVSGGPAAAESLRAGKFDVLLTDVWLPEGSCFPFLEEHRRELPRFVVTMSGFELEKLEFQKVGIVRGHLVKPFQAEQLDSLLEEFANERALSGLHDSGGAW